MELIKTKLDGVFIVKPQVFSDNRGYFMETWSRAAFLNAGLDYDFVQDNSSFSAVKGTLRGIHFQRGEYSQAKLVSCRRGAVLDVVVDLRGNSPTYGRWDSFTLTAENKYSLLIPRGFGHAFLTLTDNVEFTYKADNPYVPQSEGSIRWNDPALGIDFGIDEPILSEKDKNAPLLRDVVTGFESW